MIFFANLCYSENKGIQMPRTFNTAGLYFPEDHIKRLGNIIDLIASKKYFNPKKTNCTAHR